MGLDTGAEGAERKEQVIDISIPIKRFCRAAFDERPVWAMIYFPLCHLHTEIRRSGKTTDPVPDTVKLESVGARL